MKKTSKSSTKKTVQGRAKARPARTSSKKSVAKRSQKKAPSKKTPKKTTARRAQAFAAVAWHLAPKGCCTIVPATGPSTDIPGLTEAACEAIENAHPELVTSWNPGACAE
jgi:hypothetical protein